MSPTVRIKRSRLARGAYLACGLIVCGGAVLLWPAAVVWAVTLSFLGYAMAFRTAVPFTAMLCAAFLAPFVWMVLMSLTPDDQIAGTLSLTPQAYYLEREGKQVEVVLGRTLLEDSASVRITGGARKGARIVVSVDKIDNGFIDDPVSAARAPVEVIRIIPAGMVHAHPRPPAGGELPKDEQWQEWVDPQSVQTRTQFRWEHYPRAIERIAPAGGVWRLASPPGPDERGLLAAIRRQLFTKETRVNFWVYLANTLFVAIMTVIGAMISCSLVAYGFSRIEWPGRDLVFFMCLATMMIPHAVFMVPLYSLFSHIKWVGTLTPLWAFTWFGTPFYIFLLRQFFLTLPKALSDSAHIDGANEFQTFWHIILPLARPTILVVALFQFLHSWNDFIGPLIYLTEPDTFTLSLALQQFQGQGGGTPWSLLMAASTMIIVPVLILFFFTQKALLEGIATTGLKG